MNFYALDSETGRLMMIDLTECNDGFQPLRVIHCLNGYDSFRPSAAVRTHHKPISPATADRQSQAAITTTWPIHD